MKKKILSFSLIFLLALPTVSAYKIKCTIPSDICITQDKYVKINLGGFISGKDNTGFDKNNLLLTCPSNGSYDINLKLFGIFPIKTVTVSAMENSTICPSGDVIGIKLYTDGVSVSAVEKQTPADKAGLCCADVITHLNDVKILNSAHFSSFLKENGNKEIKITFLRNNCEQNIFLTPMCRNGEYLIGAWIRDSSAGIGTVTYIDVSNQKFGALGHGICDSDTQSLLTLMQGNITNCNVTGSVKGKKGFPGKLCGVLENNDIGTVEKNSALGIYGNINANAVEKQKPMDVASRFEVHEGNASILTSIDNDKPQEYDAVIEKVNTSDESGMSMILKITDRRLLEKTGGIVQGMSGSPILQDGKFIGAVTHVFLNDSTRGYGVFIELMLKESGK